MVEMTPLSGAVALIVNADGAYFFCVLASVPEGFENNLKVMLFPLKFSQHGLDILPPFALVIVPFATISNFLYGQCRQEATSRRIYKKKFSKSHQKEFPSTCRDPKPIFGQSFFLSLGFIAGIDQS
jgi:hypothetical protein